MKMTESLGHGRGRSRIFIAAVSVMGLAWVAVLGCVSAPTRWASPPIVKDEITVMTFNVENLFDTQPDKDREDFTFLPRALKNTQAHKMACQKNSSARRRQECLEMDWNENSLKRKFARLSDVIRQVNNGAGPDILIMPEVENINVLTRFNKEALADLGYISVVLLEGPDLRGIDIGMLSRMPLAEAPKLHVIPFKPQKDGDAEWMARSRGILEATFRHASGQMVTAFGVHFPSQANPTYWREQSVDFLNALKRKLPEDRVVIAAGDFNISREEDLRKGLFRERLGQDWLVSHYIGCGQCIGTHNYSFSWSFLDALLFDPKHGPSGKHPWRIDIDSIQVVNSSRYQVSNFMTPARFDEESPVGVSDHYPMIAKIRLSPPSAAQAQAGNE